MTPEKIKELSKSFMEQISEQLDGENASDQCNVYLHVTGLMIEDFIGYLTLVSPGNIDQYVAGIQYHIERAKKHGAGANDNG